MQRLDEHCKMQTIYYFYTGSLDKDSEILQPYIRFTTYCTVLVLYIVKLQEGVVATVVV